jgi:hypothetical protein
MKEILAIGTLCCAIFVGACDTQQRALPKFDAEAVARAHNAELSRALKQFQATPVYTQQELRAVFLSPELQGVVEYAATDINRRLGTLGKNEKTLEEMTLADLHAAGILSAAQLQYLQQVEALDPEAMGWNDFYAATYAVEQAAMDALGPEGDVVAVYAATYRASASYWQASGAAWEAALAPPSKSASPQAIPWGRIARFDGAGASVGLVVGIYQGFKAGAASSLMFGPGGGIVVGTGVALGNVAGYAAAASAVAFAEYLWGVG